MIRIIWTDFQVELVHCGRRTQIFGVIPYHYNAPRPYTVDVASVTTWVVTDVLYITEYCIDLVIRE